MSGVFQLKLAEITIDRQQGGVKKQKNFKYFFSFFSRIEIVLLLRLDVVQIEALTITKKAIYK